MNKFRKLKTGEKAEELDSPVSLIIKTKCPTKWVIEDLETGQRYRANGNTEAVSYTHLTLPTICSV